MTLAMLTLSWLSMVKPPRRALSDSRSQFLSFMCVSIIKFFFSVRHLRQQVVIMDNGLKNSAISYIFLYC